MTPIQVTNHPDRETKLINFFPSTTQLMRNVNSVALPAIVLFVASNLQTADAGPIAWAACVEACEAVTPSATTAGAIGVALVSLMSCVTACGAVLLLPFPP